MNSLRKFVDKIKPHFEKGGKLEKLHSTFDAFETFLFVPNTVTKSGAHIRDNIDMKRTMIMVVFALAPSLLFGMWNVGHQYYEAIGAIGTISDKFLYGLLEVLPIIVVSYIVGLSIEFGIAQARGHEVNEGVLVTCFLIPLIVPVDIPLWMVAVATAFAVVLGKEVFGGTGMNILNPALTTRAFLFFAYPTFMSGDKVWVSRITEAYANKENPEIGRLITDNGDKIVDAFTGATPLAEAAAGNIHHYSIFDMFIGSIPGSIGETSTLAILLGALLLIYTGVGSWKIILSVFAGGIAMGGLFNALSGIYPDNAFLALPAYEHLMLGGFAFGAVFMATDPVTASQTERGKWIYGFLIGVLAIMVRVLNPAYPEGVMLAILLMNVFAPLIDHLVIRKNIKRRMRRIEVNSKQ